MVVENYWDEISELCGELLTEIDEELQQRSSDAPDELDLQNPVDIDYMGDTVYAKRIKYDEDKEDLVIQLFYDSGATEWALLREMNIYDILNIAEQIEIS